MLSMCFQTTALGMKYRNILYAIECGTWKRKFEKGTARHKEMLSKACGAASLICFTKPLVPYISDETIRTPHSRVHETRYPF